MTDSGDRTGALQPAPVRSSANMAEFTLGEYIRDKRIEAGLKLREFARRLDVTPSYVSDIENDRRIPSEDVLQRVATTLGLAVDELVARSGRLGTDAEKYLRHTPAATTLFRRISEQKLNDDQLRQLMNKVNDFREEVDAGEGQT